MEQNELLRYTIRALHELGISYLIGGSLASSAYGEPRLTNDIDLVADLRSSQVPGLLAKFPMDDFHLDGEAVKGERREAEGVRGESVNGGERKKRIKD